MPTLPSVRKTYTPAEMERIRKADAIIAERARKEFKPEPNTTAPFAYFEVSRYKTGNFCGLFVLAQLMTEDESGKPSKRPIRKVIADGVYLRDIADRVGDALGKRLSR